MALVSMSVDGKLETLTEYAVENFENVTIGIRTCLEFEIHSINNVIANTAGAVAKFGGKNFISHMSSTVFSPLLGSATKQIINIIEQKITKSDQLKLFDFTASTKDKEKLDSYIKIIIEICFELFYCFEQQFTNLTANGGEKRGMMKIAKYIISIIMLYFINNDKAELTSENIIKEILSNKSYLNHLKDSFKVWQYPLIPKPNRSIQLSNDNSEENISLAKLFIKTGLEIDEKYYSADDKNPEKYGYRRPNGFENVTKLIEELEMEDKMYKQYEYVLKIENKEDKLLYLYNMISSRDPNKLEQRLKEYIDDCNRNLKTNMDESAKKLLENLSIEIKKHISAKQTTNQTTSESYIHIGEIIGHGTTVEDNSRHKTQTTHSTYSTSKELGRDLLEENKELKKKYEELKIELEILENDLGLPNPQTSSTEVQQTSSISNNCKIKIDKMTGTGTTVKDNSYYKVQTIHSSSNSRELQILEENEILRKNIDKMEINIEMLKKYKPLKNYKINSRCIM